jgi:hypothetical protein
MLNYDTLFTGWSSSRSPLALNAQGVDLLLSEVPSTPYRALIQGRAGLPALEGAND